MSLAGARQYDANLRKLMDSESFKKASLASQLNMGYSLLNSKYGKGSFMGFGRVHSLPDAVDAKKSEG